MLLNIIFSHHGRLWSGVLAAGLMAMALGYAAAPAAEVNLYSARKEALIKPLLDQFTKQTGIRVNLVTGKADALLQRLKSEGKYTPADVLITVDAGRVYRAKQAGLLQPINSSALAQAIPARYRDPDNTWFGLSLRARPILYALGRLDPSTLKNYEDLADSRWKRKVCIRSSNNIYNQSLVASMIVANGAANTETWAKGLVANFARPPKGGDRDQIKAAAAGLCDIAIANTYYLGGMLRSKNGSERIPAQKMGIIWPNQSGRGTHVNISAAGVTRYAQHKSEAIKLLEFLVSDKAQRFYAERNYEYPIKPGVRFNDALKAWGPFKADTLNLSLLGEHNAEAVRLMDRAGWR
jgi:iron(III) transport system substrate-binding protein